MLVTAVLMNFLRINLSQLCSLNSKREKNKPTHLIFILGGQQNPFIHYSRGLN